MDYLSLAQVFAYQTNADPSLLLILVLIIVGIIGLRAFNGWRESKKKPTRPLRRQSAKIRENKYSSPSAEPVPIRKLHMPTDKHELKRVSEEFGFTPAQSAYFAELCTENNISSPLHLVRNSRQLDELFRRTFHQLEAPGHSNREAENSKTLLFTLRETIENRKRNSKLVSSTRSINDGIEMTVITKSNEHYSTILHENNQAGLVFPVPRDVFGNELRMPLLSKLTVLFYMGNGQSYSFVTRVSRYISAQTATLMMLRHTEKVRALPNRRHDRKQMRTPANFSRVTVANIVNGRHTEHRFYPSGKAFMATLLDISAGGCSLITSTPVNEGEYVEINCIISGNSEDTMIGKVVKLNPGEAKNTIVMHVRFAKMPRVTLNRIFTYIYNYGER